MFVADTKQGGELNTKNISHMSES